MVTQAMARQSREIGSRWLRVMRAIEGGNGAVGAREAGTWKIWRLCELVLDASDQCRLACELGARAKAWVGKAAVERLGPEFG